MSDPYTWPEPFRAAWDADMRACGLDPDARVPYDPADNEDRDTAAEDRQERRAHERAMSDLHRDDKRWGRL